MRRLWMSLLVVPVIAVAVPTAALASPSAPAARTRPAAAADALQPGMSGAAVEALQRRLAALKYYPGSIDGRFGTNTLEAVWAFEEVQGLPAHDYVTSAMQRALAHPRAPRVLVPHGGANRVEVSLSREVLVLYHNNRVELISHVSTGGGYYYCSNGGCAYAVTPTDAPPDHHVHARLGHRPARRDVQPGVLHRHRICDSWRYRRAATSGPLARLCADPHSTRGFFHTLVPAPGTPVYIR